VHARTAHTAHSGGGALGGQQGGGVFAVVIKNPSPTDDATVASTAATAATATAATAQLHGYCKQAKTLAQYAAMSRDLMELLGGGNPGTAPWTRPDGFNKKDQVNADCVTVRCVTVNCVDLLTCVHVHTV
jgi:hypothetical protein